MYSCCFESALSLLNELSKNYHGDCINSKAMGNQLVVPFQIYEDEMSLRAPNQLCPLAKYYLCNDPAVAE